MSKKVVILGAGESGIGAALLSKAKGYDYILSDGGSIKAEFKEEIIREGLRFEEGGHSMEVLQAADIVVKSPGIPDKSPVIKQLMAWGKVIISEIEFGYQHIDRTKKIIAITGTNGKTTTTLLTYHLMQSCGYSVGLGGNIGKSFARLAVADVHDYYVLEVSSFQLDGIDHFKPDVAVLLNITPDHLDRYDYQFEKYVASKFRIVRNMGQENAFIYFNESQPVVEELNRRNIEASLFAISVSHMVPKNGGFLKNGHLVFNYKQIEHKIPVSEITLIGKHNMVNSMAAVLALLCMEAPLASIIKGLKTFKNAAHRLEPVAVIDGVTFINDSKATNVDSVYYALEGINANIVWLAGGIDKGNDYSQIDTLVREKVKHLMCIGTDNAPLTSFFGEWLPYSEETNIQLAVNKAFEVSKPGDVVLLSPACASFDCYKNYEDRGDKFKLAVADLASRMLKINNRVS